MEQIFLSSETYADNKSRHFTIRTSEKAPELVQASINRLLELHTDADGKPLAKPVQLLKRIEMEPPKIIDKTGQTIELAFKDPAGKEEV